MLNDRTKLKEEDVSFCEYWLSRTHVLSREMTHPRFTQDVLVKLLRYEMLNKQRWHVITRVIGRYYRIERDAELKRAEELLNA